MARRTVPKGGSLHRQSFAANAIWTGFLPRLHANGNTGRGGGDWPRGLDRKENRLSASCSRESEMLSQKENDTKYTCGKTYHNRAPRLIQPARRRASTCIHGDSYLSWSRPRHDDKPAHETNEPDGIVNKGYLSDETLSIDEHSW